MRFNRERLSEAGMGDPEFIRELAQMMLSDGEERVRKLQAAATATDWETAGQIAHSMKGAALTVGAEDLAALCATVDDSVRRLQCTDGAAAIDAIAAEFGAVREVIQREIQEVG
ncbi:Hpt domain-containing protein [candidate division KSB1 bacterium]|nr:Hpt domain-containing protein [candidate division KSB1 bacterium]